MTRVLPSDVASRIDWVFPWVRKGQPPRPTTSQQVSMDISAVLTLIEQIPDSLLRFDARDYGNFLWAQATLKQLVQLFQGGLGAADWPVFENVDAMTTLWLLLKKCPDEGISEGTAGLPFIQDESLRGSIQLDMSSADSAFNNGEWKAATVLAAAAVEALLLWSLIQRPEADRQSAIEKHKLNLDAARLDGPNWSLAKYITVAGELGLFRPETVTQAGLAKDFRNLIHPGREKRLQQKCDRGTARSALAALDLVVRDLETRFAS